MKLYEGLIITSYLKHLHIYYFLAFEVFILDYAKSKIKTQKKNLNSFELEKESLDLYTAHAHFIFIHCIYSAGNQLTCDCGNPAIILTVRKEGPNQGRDFGKCESQQCNYFQFTDEPPRGPPGGQQAAGPTRFNTGNIYR